MEVTDDIRWGIVGCGDVCEIKSGPAFNKIARSKLVAVMRRDAEKARDFAFRHQVRKYYSDANALINDPEVNAVYIATPPAFHEMYAIQALNAGKPVYLEKPVALDSRSCARIVEASRTSRVKISVAHYRRALPVYKKVKSLVNEGAIGKPLLVLSRTLQPPTTHAGAPGYWRTNPEISGGGLFFDLSPHQLDLFYWIFGAPLDVRGLSLNQRNAYAAPDVTALQAVFPDNVLLHATWAFFNASPAAEEEKCEIIGDQGKITFSFFKKSDIEVTSATAQERLTFDYPENIQQPMIAEVVKFFLGEGPNPCPVDDALVTMQIMDSTRMTASRK